MYIESNTKKYFKLLTILLFIVAFLADVIFSKNFLYYSAIMTFIICIYHVVKPYIR